MAITYNLGNNPIWAFLDPSGKPAVGYVWQTFYNTSRDTPRPVYQDPGGFIKYPLAIELNTAGQVSENPIYFQSNGSDDSGYYITVTAPGEPEPLYVFQAFTGGSGGGGGGGITLIPRNQIINGQFTFNNGNIDTAASGLTNIAPGWYFNKNNASASDAITFIAFPLGQTVISEGNPINYLSFNCSSAGSGETVKTIEARIPRVNAFEMQQISIQFQGQSTTSSQVTVSVMQNFGTGGTPSAPVTTAVGTYTLTNAWQKFSQSIVVPSTGGKTLGTNGDDYIAVQFNLPLNATGVINMTNVQDQLGSIAGPYDYLTYQGSVAQTFGSELPIPEPKQITYSTPTPLLGLVDVLKPIITGTNNVYTLLDNAGEVTMWPCNISLAGFPDKPIFPPPFNCVLCNGQTLDGYLNNFQYYRLGSRLGTTWGPGYDGFYWNTLSAAPNLQVINQQQGVIAQAADFNTGLTITTPVPGGPGVNQITQIVCKAPSLVPQSSYFTINRAGGQYYVWFSIDGAGVDPAVPGKVGIPVPLLSTGSATDMYFTLMLQLAVARFVVPPLNQGLFVRGGPITSNPLFQNYDPDNSARQPLITGGTPGNAVGSYQPFQVQSHLHGLTFTGARPALVDLNASGSINQAPGGYSTAGPPSSTNAFGTSTQTNPVNAYMAYIIKY